MIVSNNILILNRLIYFLFHLELNRYSEDNANALYVDDCYSTSFYVVYSLQAKMLGEFYSQ